jgi:Sulfotransferase domain
MPLRERLPKSLHGVARSSYLTVGSATSSLRMSPEFIVIGGQRCGTTSLFKNLAEHPQVMRPGVDKGIDYFSLYYGRDEDWYRGHFPLRRLARARTAKAGPPVAFEACTYYLFHPLALERIARDLPQVKLVAMLRDPVERAYSAYKHELARGFETVPDFARALALEDERLAGEIDRMRADVGYESIAHRHHAYRRRGQYAEQLERALALFAPEQLHVLESESYFAQPEREYAAILDFLGLSRYGPTSFERHNARPGSPMPGRTRELLTEHYAPHDERLAALLGRRPGWVR